VFDLIQASRITEMMGIEGWLVPDLIPKKGLVVLAAAPKAGKSVFASYLARQLSTGGEFLGHPLEKGGVLWAAHEETREERKPFLEGLTDDDPFYLSFTPYIPCLDDMDCTFERDQRGRYNPDAVPYLFGRAQEINAKLLVIDCLHAACRHTNLADNQAARRIMGKLRLWSHTHNIATLVLHHVTKSATRGYHPERFADSAQILAAASTHFFMESHHEADGSRHIVLHGSGRNPTPPRRIDINSRNPFDFQRVDEESRQGNRPTINQQIVDLLAEGWALTAEEIASRIGAKPRVVRNALTKLTDGTVERCEGTRTRHRYRLLGDESQDHIPKGEW